MFILLYSVILYQNYIKFVSIKIIKILLLLLVKNPKKFSFTLSKIKKIVALVSQFSVKLNCHIAFGSTLRDYCILKSIAINV